jgi:nucleotide-binding universal stress UspA family protein
LPALPRSILVPVDFSTASTDALARAVALAQQFAGKITLLHVLEPVRIPAGLGEPASGAMSGEVKDSKMLAVRLQALARRAIPGPVRGELFIGEGDAGQVIVSAARQIAADLIVLATSGHSGLQRLLLGSTAEFVIRRSGCPVLTVPPRAGRKPAVKAAHARFQNVLAPVDLFEPSRRALRYAAALAAGLRAKLTLLHVVPALENPRGRPLQESRENARAAAGAEARLAALVAREAPAHRPATQVVFGDAAEEILRAATGSARNVIVMGTHGRGAVGGLLLGSTALNVVRHAPCPVLVVRQRSARLRHATVTKLFFPVAPFLP